MEGDNDVEIDATDLVEIIGDYEDRLKNLPMDVYAVLLTSKVDEMFQTEGAAGTEGPWEPLMASTLKRHPRRKGGQILQDTGATAANIRAEEVGWTIQLIPGTAYAGFHVSGTENMVARDFFAINFAQTLDEMGEMVLQDLQ